MKKKNSPSSLWTKLLLLLVLFAISGTSMAQVFMNPRYKAKNAENVQLESIKITEEFTIFCFKVIPKNNTALYVSSKTYITNSEGGDPLFIEKATYTQNVPTFQNGNISILSSTQTETELELNKPYYEFKQPLYPLFYFYFPKVGNQVKNINFRSGEDGNFWHFFEINISSNIGIDNSVKSGEKGKKGNCRFIESPGYMAKSGNFDITTVELCDTATILHFKVVLNQGAWFTVPAKSCIRDSKGGENLFVTLADGTNIGQKYTVDDLEGNVAFYRLYFPPIKKNVKNIDFREIEGSWAVYELDVDTDSN